MRKYFAAAALLAVLGLASACATQRSPYAGQSYQGGSYATPPPTGGPAGGGTGASCAGPGKA